MDARYSSTAQFPITLLYANEEPGRGHLSPISDSPFAPGTFSRAQPSWQGTWLVFRARDFRVFQRADAPFFWAVELRVHDYKGCSCDMRERERERMSGFGLGARCAAPSCRVWSVELPVGLEDLKRNLLHGAMKGKGRHDKGQWEAKFERCREGAAGSRRTVQASSRMSR